jgi:hypothetical protein
MARWLFRRTITGLLVRVIVGARDVKVRWFPTTLDPIGGRLVIDALKHNILFSTLEEHHQQLLNEIKSLDGPPQMRTQLADLIRRVPRTDRDSQPPIDLYAEDQVGIGGAKLVETIISDSFTSRKEERAGSVLSGNARDEVFRRHWMPYAAAASAVWCLDQYLLTNLDHGHADGLLWFLDSCLAQGVTDFVIFSALPKSGHLEKCSTVLKSRLHVPLALRQRQVAVNVTLVAAHHRLGNKRDGGDGTLIHDRHIRFRIGADVNRATPTFDIGPGFDVFNRAEISQSFTILEEPNSSAAKSRESHVARYRQTTQLKVKVD